MGNMKYHKINSVYKRDEKGNFIYEQFSCPEFYYLKDNEWVGTEKVDGTNIRIYKDGRIAGRTDNAQIHPELHSVLEIIRDRLVASDLPDDTVIYGEGYGAKIQSGGRYIKDNHSFALFDVMIAGNYQPRYSVEDIAKKLSISIVPIIGVFTLTGWIDLICSGKKKGSALHPGTYSEGVVLRPKVELQTRDGDRIITKLKFRDFGK